MTDLCKEINKLGKGLSSETRYRIIEALLKGKKSVTELVKIVGLSQPLVSQHLKALKTFDLVTDERHGQEIYYQVNANYALKLLKNLVNSIQNTKN